MSAKKNHRRKNRERQPYRGSRAVDASCRCHGSCPACRANRTKALQAAWEDAKERIEHVQRQYAKTWRTNAT